MTTAVDSQEIRQVAQEYVDRRNELVAQGGDGRFAHLENPETVDLLNRLLKLSGAESVSDFGIDSMHHWGTGGNPKAPLSADSVVQHVEGIRKRSQRTEEETEAVRAEYANPTTRDGLEGEELQDAVQAARASATPPAPGMYRYDRDADDFVRVGDPEPLRRYHGTSTQVEGDVYDRLQVSPANWDSENRVSVGVMPAVYTTNKADAALTYAHSGGDDGDTGYLYVVDIHANSVADLKDCQDEDVARRAIEAGFDVVECPDFWEQPETIVFDENQVQIRAVYPTMYDDPYDDPDYDPDEDDTVYEGRDDDDREVKDLVFYGSLMNPVYRDDGPPRLPPAPQQPAQPAQPAQPPPELSRERGMESISRAVGEYQSSREEATAQGPDIGLSREAEYRGAPKQPTYRARGGRGSMRY